MCPTLCVCHQVRNKTRQTAATWMLWAGLWINGESPGQHEMTGLLCKVRSSDTALDRESEREQVLRVTQHPLLAACLCVFGKHTLPEIELECVSKRNIVFLSDTNILLQESVSVRACVWVHVRVCVSVCQGSVIPLESQWGGCEALEHPV